MPKLNPDSPLRSLMETFPIEGRLEWIGLRPGRRAPLQSMNHVEVIADHGLAGESVDLVRPCSRTARGYARSCQPTAPDSPYESGAGCGARWGRG
jgi:hypothetical protein